MISLEKIPFGTQDATRTDNYHREYSDTLQGFSHPAMVHRNSGGVPPKHPQRVWRATASAFFTGSICLLLSLSGAAALIYQVGWVRSLTLVFGGSHLAVTVVAVSMSRASIMFVDKRAKVVYGQQYVNDYAHGEVIQWFVDEVMTAVGGPIRRKTGLRPDSGKLSPQQKAHCGRFATPSAGRLGQRQSVPNRLLKKAHLR